MLSETLITSLEGYAIGPKIRRLRLRKKLGLVQLSEHTGLSPAMLSKIERGHLFPTLPTLLRIALVFGVGLDHFFREDSDRPVHAVVRKADRIRLPEKGDGLRLLTASSRSIIRSETASSTATTSSLGRKTSSRSRTSIPARRSSTFWMASSW
jgi:transcriptional regulator with XRE-family HTH domain